MSREASAAPFVILGCGHAGVQAASILRQEGYEGELVLVGAEARLPYERPPLSKQLLGGDVAVERLQLKKPDFYAEKRITLRLGGPASEIDRAARCLRFSDGAILSYAKLLIATGSTPRRLNVPGAELPGVFTLLTLDDALAIRARLTSDARVVVVGGGYIGLEVAATARKLGARVTLLEASSRLLGRVAAEPVAAFFAAEHRAHGVDLRLSAKLTAIGGGTYADSVILEDGSRIVADLIVVGIGSEPADELARATGLSCRNGIVVDAYGRTEDPDIFAAGDVSQHFDPRSSTHRRLECVQNALGQAQSAARAMLGILRPHEEIPSFWSEQYDLRLQIIGLGSSADDIVLRGDPDSRKFSALHVREGRLVAVEAVNTVRDFIQGKQIIASGREIDLARAAHIDLPLTAAMIEPASA